MQPINIIINDSEILNLLEAYKEEDREKMIIKALHLGLIALKDIETKGNVDYVEKEFQKLKSGVDQEFNNMKQEFESKLKTTDEQIQKKLYENFDPKIGIMPRVMETYLGEGGKLSDLFDENNNTSAVSKIKRILGDYFDTDASRVVRLLDSNDPESPLYSLKNDISTRLFAIEKEIRAKESAKDAASEEAAKGTQKGIEYEDIVFSEIEKIAKIFGDTCLPTGKEVGLILDSKLGDSVITINNSDTGGATLKIAFEAKDKSMYLSTLLDEIEGAKSNRGAGVAIAVVNGRDTLKDVNQTYGVFREYPSNKIVCVFDKENPDTIALEVAYKLARSKLLLGLKASEMKSDKVDLASINTLIGEIIKKLSEFSAIKSTLTKASSAITGAQTQIDIMKEELQVKLDELSEKAKPVSNK